MIEARTSILTVLLYAAVAGATPIAAQDERPLPLHTEVLHAPQLARTGGAWYLVYELHFTNFSGGAFELLSVEMFADSQRTRPYDRFAGDRLVDNLKHFPAADSDSALDVIAPGRRVALMAWLPVDTSALPRMLEHRLTARVVGREDLWIVTTPAIEIAPRLPVVIGPPLRGGPWVAVYAPNPSAVPGHTRLVFPRDSRMRFPQRFSADWLQLGPEGRAWSGDIARNESWFAYGEQVLAVADGVVALVLDSVAENTPPEVTTRMTQATVAGNYVVLDIGDGRYAVYGHLRPGSPRVRAGDRVQRGDVIAQVGNSGNSTAGHLHFHILDAAHTAAGEGQAFVIDRYLLAGAIDVTLDELDAGAAATVPVGGEPRENDLPRGDAIVYFP